jgi:hypothetical protein
MATVDRLLAHAMSLCELYAAVEWGDTGAPAMQDLFARHLGEQHALVASLLKRAVALGATAPLRTASGAVPTGALAAGASGGIALLRRIVEAHELGQCEFETMWRQAAIDGDRATYDLVIDEVVRTNERQSWLMDEQLVRLDNVRT